MTNENQNTGPPGVASAEEVLAFLTGVMRGDESGSTQNLKAAELLGKRFGLFSERADDLPAPVIIDDLADGGKPSEGGARPPAGRRSANPAGKARPSAANRRSKKSAAGSDGEASGAGSPGGEARSVAGERSLAEGFGGADG